MNWLKQLFCIHDWKYWDYIMGIDSRFTSSKLIDSADESDRQLKFKDHFRKCKKCQKKMRKNLYDTSFFKYERTKMEWNEEYPVVGKISKSMKSST